MATITWNKAMDVGFDEIDADHKRLVDACNVLIDQVENGAATCDLEKTLDRLLSEAERHFHNEERLMLEHEYPEIREHKEEHARLLYQARELRKEFLNGDATVPAFLAYFLSDWVKAHIIEVDRRLGRFLAGRAS